MNKRTSIDINPLQLAQMIAHQRASNTCSSVTIGVKSPVSVNQNVENKFERRDKKKLSAVCHKFEEGK